MTNGDGPANAAKVSSVSKVRAERRVHGNSNLLSVTATLGELKLADAMMQLINRLEDIGSLKRASRANKAALALGAISGTLAKLGLSEAGMLPLLTGAHALQRLAPKKGAGPRVKGDTERVAFQVLVDAGMEEADAVVAVAGMRGVTNGWHSQNQVREYLKDRDNCPSLHAYNHSKRQRTPAQAMAMAKRLFKMSRDSLP